jgi:hypothetical protein
MQFFIDLTKTWMPIMKETPRRRITVTSSLFDISRISWEIGRGRRYSARPFYKQISGQIFKDDVKVFPPSRIFAS